MAFNLAYTVESDKFGNRYFEDTSETYGRHRWVEYAESRGYDSLKIPPDWHAWLHHNTDVAPTKRPLKAPEYQGEVTGNQTGTGDAYVPSHHRLHKQYSGFANEKYEVSQLHIHAIVQCCFAYLFVHCLLTSPRCAVLDPV